MNIFNFNVESFVQYTMVFVRMSALVFTLPIIGSGSVPRVAKIGFTAMVAYVIFMTVKLPTIDLGMSVGKLVFSVLGEVAIGLTIGFTSQLLFTAVQVAGAVIGFQMGFAIVNVIDPATDSQVSVTAQFQNIMALLIFLAINGHHWLIQAGCDSFNTIQILGFHPSAGLTQMIIDLTRNVFVEAVKLASPIIASLVLLNIALALISRTVPQMNVFIVGFPLQIAIGLFMMGATAPIFLLIFKEWFSNLNRDLEVLIRLMA